MADDIERTRDVLINLAEEIRLLAAREPSTSSAAFTSWQSRTRSTLSKALGTAHHITTSVVDTRWTPSIYAMGDTSAFVDAFRAAAQRVQGYLEAAGAELESVSGAYVDAAGIDPELWAYVAADVDAEQWGKAATQTTLFTEDRIRRWTGQPAQLVGEKLMTAVFGDKGNYRLGLVEGEQQGWHRLAMGVSMALRNVVGHRIQDRPGNRRYTLGVLGTCSLLLTQLRYEHGTRFHDTSPVPAADPDGGDRPGTG